MGQETKRLEFLNKVYEDETIKYCYVKSEKYHYYKPNSKGYTKDKIEAGVFEKIEAIKSIAYDEDLTVEPINIIKHNTDIENMINNFKSRLIK